MSLVSTLLIIAGTAAVTFYLYINYYPLNKPVDFNTTISSDSVTSSSGAGASSTPPVSFALPEDQPPDDKLFITPERQQYKSGDLRLVIPKLSVDTQIVDAVDDESLKQGPGLYDYAQLPGTGNRNVSIAGHRDIHGSIFYYVDTLTEGDYLYLVWNDTVYRYTYKDTTIVKADDWGPIYSQGFSCLTLTSCDPIGTSLNRIIIRAELSERTPYTAGYRFAEKYIPAA